MSSPEGTGTFVEADSCSECPAGTYIPIANLDGIVLRVGSITLVNRGGTPAYPLLECEGDCDSDSHCADGLTCFQRGNGEIIPGCHGGDMPADSDVCYDPAPGHDDSSCQPYVPPPYKMPDGCRGTTCTNDGVPDRSCYPRKAVDELNDEGGGTHPLFGPMKDWDMTEVTDMNCMFHKKWNFNSDLSKWVTSSATTMENST